LGVLEKELGVATEIESVNCRPGATPSKIKRHENTGAARVV